MLARSAPSCHEVDEDVLVCSAGYEFGFVEVEEPLVGDEVLVVNFFGVGRCLECEEVWDGVTVDHDIACGGDDLDFFALLDFAFCGEGGSLRDSILADKEALGDLCAFVHDGFDFENLLSGEGSGAGIGGLYGLWSNAEESAEECVFFVTHEYGEIFFGLGSLVPDIAFLVEGGDGGSVGDYEFG